MNAAYYELTFRWRGEAAEGPHIGHIQLDTLKCVREAIESNKAEGAVDFRVYHFTAKRVPLKEVK